MIAAKFEINGDGKNALAAFTQVKRAAHELSSDVNSQLRNTLIGAFSVEAIKEAVSATIEFAENIEKTSNRLTITTDNVQALRLAARDAGKDFSIMEKAFQNLEKSASKALGGSGTQKKAFANLGISNDDLKHLSKVDLLSKLMSGTAGMSRAGAETNLSALFGSKAAGSLMAMQPHLADFQGFKNDQKEKGNIASTEDIEALAEVKERWREIVDRLKTSLIPALAWLLDSLFRFGRGVKQLVEVFGTVIGAILGSIEKFDIGGLIKSFGENLFNGFKSLFDNLWGVITRKLTVGEALENLGKTYADNVNNSLEKGLGVNTDTVKQVIQEKLLALAEDDKKLAAEREKKHRERLNQQAKMDGDANRQSAVTGDQKEHGSKIDNILKGDSAIKIGGLMAADTNYRVNRLQFDLAASAKETADNTARTADATEQISEKMDDPDFGDGLGGYP